MSTGYGSFSSLTYVCVIRVIKDSRARNAAAFAQDVYADTKSEVSPADLDAKDVLGKTMRPSRPPRRWHRGASRVIAFTSESMC